MFKKRTLFVYNEASDELTCGHRSKQNDPYGFEGNTFDFPQMKSMVVILVHCSFEVICIL
jgi:hypothetical protein